MVERGAHPGQVAAQNHWKYPKIRSQLQLGGGEVKGKNLTETDVNRVIEILRHNAAIFEASVVDVGAHNQAVVLEYRSALDTYMESTLERFDTEGQNSLGQENRKCLQLSGRNSQRVDTPGALTNKEASRRQRCSYFTKAAPRAPTTIRLTRSL